MLAAFQQFVGIQRHLLLRRDAVPAARACQRASRSRSIWYPAPSRSRLALRRSAVIDKIGRNAILLIGSAGMAVTLFAMVYAFSHGSLNPKGNLVLPEGAGHARRRCREPLCDVFNFSWGPVMWVMLGEMFPNQIRGSALAVSGFCAMVRKLPHFVQLPGYGGEARTDDQLHLLRRLCGHQFLPRQKPGARNSRRGA